VLSVSEYRAFFEKMAISMTMITGDAGRNISKTIIWDSKEGT
jgi:hypothetical protein